MRVPEPVPTAGAPATAKALAARKPAAGKAGRQHTPAKPAPAARPKPHPPAAPKPKTRPPPKTTAKQPPKPAATPRPKTAAKSKPKPKPGAGPTAQTHPPADVLYDLQPLPSQIRPQQRPARRPPAITNAAATTFVAERATAEAQRTSSHHHPKPAPQTHRPPRRDRSNARGNQQRPHPPTRPRCLPTSSKQMPRYRRPCGPQPNPEAESGSAYPPVRARPRPAGSLRTSTAQDYEDSPRPTAATSPHDSTTRTHAHAHAHAQGHGPARGAWWQRWTHTQLWALRKWVRAEPSLEGLVRRPRGESAVNRRLQPAGGWMLQAAWEAMLADALHPQGVQARELPAPQDHPYVLRRLRETLQETRRERRRLWDITPSPAPPTDTPSRPQKRRRTDAGSADTAPTRSTPGTPRATQHDAPDPPFSGAPI